MAQITMFDEKINDSFLFYYLRDYLQRRFPEKLLFQDNSYRTSRLNEAVRLIYALGKDLGETKNRKSDKNLCLSGWVDPTEQISNRFIENIRIFAEIK